VNKISDSISRSILVHIRTIHNQIKSMQKFSPITAKSFALTCFSALSLLAATPARSATLGGDILPSNTVLNGYSLTDMAAAIAPWQDTFDPALLPSTPFQLLTAATANYNVTPDTYFYVPIASVNDSPPILGTFPTDASQSAFYWYDASQLGVTASITVDGQETFLDPSYLAGPVNVPLPNGGSNTILFATFLTPFALGTHTVSVQSTFNGALLAGLCGPNVCAGRADYTVTSTTVPEPASLLGTLVFGAAVVALKRKQKLSRSNSAPIQ
jgi:hypothetical protein